MVTEGQEAQVEMTDEQLVEQAVEGLEAEASAGSPDTGTPEVQEEQQEASELDAEAQLAAEALAATEEAAQVDHVPTKVVAELREDRRNLRTEVRQLRDTIQTFVAERNKQEEPPPEPSPAEKFIAQHADTFDPDVEPLPASVQIAERKWQKAQDEQQVSKRQQQEDASRQAQSLATAQSQFSDFEDVIEIGKRHLTIGNQVDVRNSADPAKTLYKLCIEATLKSGGADAALMRQNLRAKLQTKKAQQAVPKINQQPTNTGTQPVTNKKAGEEEEVETPLSPDLARLQRVFG